MFSCILIPFNTSHFNLVLLVKKHTALFSLLKMMKLLCLMSLFLYLSCILLWQHYQGSVDKSRGIDLQGVFEPSAQSFFKPSPIFWFMNAFSSNLNTINLKFFPHHCGMSWFPANSWNKTSWSLISLIILNQISWFPNYML